MVKPATASRQRIDWDNSMQRFQRRPEDGGLDLVAGEQLLCNQCIEPQLGHIGGSVCRPHDAGGWRRT